MQGSADIARPSTRFKPWRVAALMLAATVGLAGCGGGRDAVPAERGAAALQAALTALSTSPQRPDRRALATEAAAATPVTGEALAHADQLLDFAEAQFPRWFPGPQRTRYFDGYLYRHYPGSGIYLGVRAGEVHVLGGEFGDAVRGVGPLTQFVTPQPPAPSGLCALPGAADEAWATAAPVVGRDVALVLAGCEGALRTPQWRQSAGPAVPLLADKAQALGFVPSEAGDYRFDVDYVNAAGAPQRRTLALRIAAPAPVLLTLRSSHAVRMGGKVSVRAWPQLGAGDSVAEIHWSQIEGPPVQLDTRDDHLALFTAPTVPRDTLIRLRATLRSQGGELASAEVSVLVERHLQAPADDNNAVWAGDHVARVYPYRASSRHAAALVGCVYDTAQNFSGPRANLCPLIQLPLLAQEAPGEAPSVEQIMDRVVVSHDWMGRNFERLLRERDPQGELRRMFAAVTAIVIGSHVRPSFYYAGTGAIYLDADNFWLSPEERDTLNEAPDYRSSFSNGLAYRNLWRYVRDGRNLFVFRDARLREGRSLDEMRDDAISLLYHELGHALDYLPPADHARLRSLATVWENIWPRYGASQLPSDVVSAVYPLRSSVMAGLAQVKFFGATADAAQAALTPQQVGEQFAADVASDDYSYSNPREDLAMLVEEVLMARRQGAQRDVAFSDPFERGTSSGSIFVRWGQRGRIGEGDIRPRAREALQQIAPWFDVAEIEQLPAPTPLRIGASWRDNLTPLGAPKRALAAGGFADLVDAARLEQELAWQARRRGSGPGLPPTPAQARLHRHAERAGLR